MLKHFTESLPVAAFTLTPPIQPLEHNLPNLTIESIQHTTVAADTVIVEVTQQLLTQLDKDCSCSKLTAVLLNPCEYCR